MKKIYQSEFIKNIFVLSSGTIIAQIITIGITPFITRLYTPENFGILALFSAILIVIFNICSLSYDRVILLPKLDKDAKYVLYLSLGFTILTLIFVFLIFLICHKPILELIEKKEISTWLWILPLGAFLLATEGIFKFWRTRLKQYKAISFSKIFGVSSSAITKLSIGLIIGPNSGGLIIGYLVGIFSSLITLFYHPSKYKFQKISSIPYEKLKILAKRYKSFPLFATWNRLLNSLSQNIIIFIFSFLFSPIIVGYYSLSSRVLEQPVYLIAQSVQNVYFQKSASDLSKGLNVLSGFIKTTVGLFLTGLPPFILVAIFSETIFIFVFGQNWRTAGIYAEILTPWFFSLYVSGPANVVYEILQKQNIKLILNISMTIGRIGALFIGYYNAMQIESIIFLFMIINVFFQVLIIFTGFILVWKSNNSSRSTEYSL